MVIFKTIYLLFSIYVDSNHCMKSSVTFAEGGVLREQRHSLHDSINYDQMVNPALICKYNMSGRLTGSEEESSH